MNDIFYFMEICDLVNYADDNTLSVIERTVQTKKDAENAMKWLKDNFMHVNPEKFQFMFLKKYTSNEFVPKFIEIHGREIKCEKEVNV